MILCNKEKYSISAMCRVLNIPRSLVYYKRKIKVYNTKLENAVITIFKESKNNYGTRKIKVELKKQNIIASRRKIREIMNKYRLISNYTVKQYKVHKSKCNNEKMDNILNREFDDREDLEIVVSDLTYVNVAGKWHYICLLINLFNREIVGYSAGTNKDAKLVYQAFMNSNIDLRSYILWYNNKRIHSALNYMSPIEYRLANMTE